jgi:hypothetical protein
MKISRIHHAAYRCKDAKETVEWYAKNLNMDFVLAIAEDLVPSTKAPVARTFMAFGTLTCPSLSYQIDEIKRTNSAAVLCIVSAVARQNDLLPTCRPTSS